VVGVVALCSGGPTQLQEARRWRPASQIRGGFGQADYGGKALREAPRSRRLLSRICFPFAPLGRPWWQGRSGEGGLLGFSSAWPAMVAGGGGAVEPSCLFSSSPVSALFSPAIVFFFLTSSSFLVELGFLVATEVAVVGSSQELSPAA
jgi:hypothetical protein